MLKTCVLVYCPVLKIAHWPTCSQPSRGRWLWVADTCDSQQLTKNIWIIMRQWDKYWWKHAVVSLQVIGPRMDGSKCNPPYIQHKGSRCCGDGCHPIWHVTLFGVDPTLFWLRNWHWANFGPTWAERSCNWLLTDKWSQGSCISIDKNRIAYIVQRLAQHMHIIYMHINT